MLKFSTLDPFGMGVEMEGGKPGWNDAMNGLPGTTIPSSLHVARIVSFMVCCRLCSGLLCSDCANTFS